MFGILKQAEDQQNKDLAIGAGALGGGALLAAKNQNKVTGMETRYHGTGKENAEGILREGLQASRAGEGVSTQRANLRQELGDEAVDGKTYLGKSRKVSKDFALQAGLKSQGVASGNILDVISDQERTIGDKIQTYRSAGKDGALLKAKIPYNDLQNGTLNVVDNPELRGMDKAEWVEGTKTNFGKNPMARMQFIANPGAERAHEINMGNSYNNLSKGTDVIQGDVDARYFKGAEGHTGQTLKGVAEYVKANPKRFATGVGAVSGGIGAAGYGANRLYNAYQERQAFIEDRMQLEKIANTDMRDWEVNTSKYDKKLEDLKKRRNPSEDDLEEVRRNFIEGRMMLDKRASYSRDGVEYGITIAEDDKGFYAKTHRARSKSYPTKEEIPIKDLKFIDSTS